MNDDWYRNTTWNAEIERAFNEKLTRARDKAQYLRIQATTLVETHPEVSLKLLDRYFEYDDLFHGWAHSTRAEALLSLDRIEEALASYEDALAREAEFPNVQSRARHNLPYLIATGGIQDCYNRASELLQLAASDLELPLDEFLWHTTHALIAADTDDVESARSHAEQALKAAGREHSGFRYHPKAGLVSAKYNDVIKKLESLSIP